MLEEFIHEPRVAYFSMEIALRNEVPTYAGGLGSLDSGKYSCVIGRRCGTLARLERPPNLEIADGSD